MRHRLLKLTCAVSTGAAVIAVSTTTVVGQSQSRTPWGDPDLQGVFTFATITPLQRPDDVLGKEVLTDEDYVRPLLRFFHSRERRLGEGR